VEGGSVRHWRAGGGLPMWGVGEGGLGKQRDKIFLQFGPCGIG
jgi:hypothetical protein